ncbi:right-handed parallel beta-helix repeat-containing protein [Cytobacillus purgationiresistens]|uniref:Right handed beta helix domain-containing protein n=1 Tax=Cytobacillus purgationiresistens TaxID=863449 RepID=A0ABU0AI58_9BACI|nr:right-handed parallel beta-helix repeat-containing protein [Cytobacillus purgationiresistens]MDQ0270939.1 hypothetical protein [Cytobacillus purgationiresistens]
MTGSYLLELTRWNIKNNGTDAPNTSMGINNAIVWAAAEGISEIVFPNGIYLIDENNPIIPQSYMTLNLGGATLRIRDNALPIYSIILMHTKQHYVRITNGKVEGDRYTHSYVGGGTHEFGVGIQLMHNVQFVTLDNLEIFNTTGDAINGITSFGSLGANFPKLQGNLEIGGINTSTGALTAASNRIRTSVNFPIVPQIETIGYFGIYGDSYGVIGNEVTTSTYDVIFYKEDNLFLSSITNLHFFDEIQVPPEASYARFVLHQSTVPSLPGNKLTIRTPEFPSQIYIEKCELHHCRRLGVAICGMKHCYVDGNKIHHIGGTSPASGIDIEDGYEINQYIYINNNNIDNNERYSIIVVAGIYVSITNNKIKSGILTINPRAQKTIIDNNHFNDCVPLLSGQITFSNNQLTSCRVRLLDTAQAILNNCFFLNTPINFNTQGAYATQVSDCKFIFDKDFTEASSNSGAPIIFSKEPQTISNCSFEGNGIEAFTVVPAGAYGWVLNNVSFRNIKHKDNRITRLPPGVYSDCRFLNCGTLGEIFSGENAIYEFNGCQFEWSSYTLFYLGQGKGVNFFKVNNSFFFNPNLSDIAFYINGTWGSFHFSNNTFNYPNGTNNPMIDIRSTAAAQFMRMNDNSFTSNKSMIAVRANTSPSIPLLFAGNILTQTNLQLHNNHIKIDNIVNGELV